MIKQRVLDYLNLEAMPRLITLRCKKHERVEKATPGTDEYNTAVGNERVATRRISDLDDIINNFSKLNFTTDTAKVKNCLSPYGTFCDRYNFYYDEKLNGTDHQELTEIIMCEYFNAIQDYFSSGLKLSEIAKKNHQSVSLILMYHVGIIEELKMPWYSQSKRGKMVNVLNQRYPDYKVITFAPNSEAVNYLFNKMVFNDPNEKLAITEKFETFEMLECVIFPYTFHLTQSGIGYYYENYGNFQKHGIEKCVASKLYFKINEAGDYIKTTSINKVIKENKEYVTMAKKLAAN